MMETENRALFSIKEASKASGVSRTTLIRLEKSGLLTPYRIDEQTGYRFYDAQNVAEVGQYQLMQTLGLSREEIADFYNQKYDTSAFLQEQQEKLNRMQNVLEEIKIRHDPSHHFSYSFIDLPKTVCYCVTKYMPSQAEGVSFFYQVYVQAIKKGYRIKGNDPIFGLSEDEFRNQTADSFEPRKVTACIPVILSEDDKELSGSEISDGANFGGDFSDGAHFDDALFSNAISSSQLSEGVHLITFPAVKAFSVLAYGDYTIIGKFCKRFWTEIEERNIHPTGHVRFIGLLAPYVNKNISPREFCYRLVVPIG